jgi:hypothetical protein
VVDGNIQAFTREVIDDGQALDPSAIGERVHDEIEAPHFVRCTGNIKRLAVRHNEFPAPALAHAQPAFSVEPINPLVV